MEPTPSWASIRTITLLPPLYREVLEQMGGAGSPAEDASTRTYSIKINNNNNTNNNNEKEEEEDLLEDAERKRERERERVNWRKRAQGSRVKERDTIIGTRTHNTIHPPNHSSFYPPPHLHPLILFPKRFASPPHFNFPLFLNPLNLMSHHHLCLNSMP